MKLSLFILLISVSSLFSPENEIILYQYQGTNIRGKVVSINYYKQRMPLTNAKIDLWWRNVNTGRWSVIATSYSDSYGFYYFRNINPGNYVIQINNNKNYNINVIIINYRYYTYQDIPILIY